MQSLSCFRWLYGVLSAQTDQPKWEDTEAALFIMTAVARSVMPTENEVVPHVVNAILSLPAEGSHIAVKQTAIHLLGKLCDWIERHPDQIRKFLFFHIR